MRLLDPEAAGFVEWFLQVRESSPWNGAVVGVREWPRPGGIQRQHAAHVEAVGLLTSELNAILVPPKGEPKPESKPEPEA